MGDFWYRFKDMSSVRGSERCGFAVIISRPHIESLRVDIALDVLMESVGKITDSAGGNAGINYKPHPDIRNMFLSINCQAGRYGLDFKEGGDKRSITDDPDKEHVYTTHNCMSPEQRLNLEKAFLLWAMHVELTRD